MNTQREDIIERQANELYTLRDVAKKYDTLKKAHEDLKKRCSEQRKQIKGLNAAQARLKEQLEAERTLRAQDNALWALTIRERDEARRERDEWMRQVHDAPLRPVARKGDVMKPNNEGVARLAASMAEIIVHTMPDGPTKEENVAAFIEGALGQFLLQHRAELLAPFSDHLDDARNHELKQELEATRRQLAASEKERVSLRLRLRLRLDDALDKSDAHVLADERAVLGAAQDIITRSAGGECDIHLRDGSAYVAQWPSGREAKGARLADAVQKLKEGV